MAGRLSLEQVRHVAKLARLALDDAQLERYRDQLSAVLEHVARLRELDVEGIEPMAHPGDLVNRLDEDEVAPPLPVERALANAPEVTDTFFAVPKTLP